MTFIFKALLLADVFENFRNKCLEIHKLDPGLARKSSLKRQKQTTSFN